MKVKLLKKLRKRFYIVEHDNRYVLHYVEGSHDSTMAFYKHNPKISAFEYARQTGRLYLLKYARSKYSKTKHHII